MDHLLFFLSLEGGFITWTRKQQRILKPEREINTIFPLENKLIKHLTTACCLWLYEELSIFSEVVRSWHD